jgi:hypothetical protein
MNKSIKINRWHALSALAFFVAMCGIAVSSDRMVMGNYSFWSRIALISALLPTIWGVALLTTNPKGVSKILPWIVIILGLLVVFIGRDYGHTAFMEILDVFGLKK